MNPIERYEAAVKEYAAAVLSYAEACLQINNDNGRKLAYSMMCDAQQNMWNAAQRAAQSRAE